MDLWQRMMASIRGNRGGRAVMVAEPEEPVMKPKPADFHGRNLTNGDFHGQTLRDADFSEASLLGADLREADLSGANFTHAVMGGARLAGADLQGAMLSSALMGDADLQNADLRGADLGEHRGEVCGSVQELGADLEGANLRGANLSTARLDGVRLQGAYYDDTTVWPREFVPEAYGAYSIDEMEGSLDGAGERDSSLF